MYILEIYEIQGDENEIMNMKNRKEGEKPKEFNPFEEVRKRETVASLKKDIVKFVFQIITVVIFLTGCSKSEGQEKLEYAETVEISSDKEEEGLVLKSGETESMEENDLQLDEPVEEELPPDGADLILDSEEWGLSFQEPGEQPIGNASAEALAWYHAYYVGDDSEKVIYLTFDCGYENGNTEPILDALKKHDAKGTFFVVGHFLETAPDLVKRMVEEGHAVGNHTYRHPDMSAISDIDSFQKELIDVETLFLEITGEELSPYYRPPQGKCNVENMKMAKELGYSTVFWSLAHVDWDQKNQPDRDKALEKLTARIHPGAIVLLHNTSQTNGEILDDLLTKWEEMGYSFAPLSELVVQE